MKQFSNKVNADPDFNDEIKKTTLQQLRNIIKNKFLIIKQQITVYYEEKCTLYDVSIDVDFNFELLAKTIIDISVQDSANLEYKESIDRIKTNFEEKLLRKIKPQADLSYSNLGPAFETYKNEALNEVRTHIIVIIYKDYFQIFNFFIMSIDLATFSHIKLAKFHQPT